MVQNGQLTENNWKSDYFSATKEQKENDGFKKGNPMVEGSGFYCPPK